MFANIPTTKEAYLETKKIKKVEPDFKTDPGELKKWTTHTKWSKPRKTICKYNTEWVLITTYRTQREASEANWFSTVLLWSSLMKWRVIEWHYYTKRESTLKFI